MMYVLEDATWRLYYSLFCRSLRSRPDLNGALFVIAIHGPFSGLLYYVRNDKKAGVEGGNWRPNNMHYKRPRQKLKLLPTNQRRGVFKTNHLP